jgi:hypothetical protein
MKTIRQMKEEQERLRERHWNPALRWSVIQDTITWAESQATVRRNTPRASLQKQARLLKSYAKKRR